MIKLIQSIFQIRKCCSYLDIYKLNLFVATYCINSSLSFCEESCLPHLLRALYWRPLLPDVMHSWQVCLPPQFVALSICCPSPTASAVSLTAFWPCCLCCCLCFATVTAAVSTRLHITRCTNLCSVMAAAAYAAVCAQYRLS